MLQRLIDQRHIQRRDRTVSRRIVLLSGLGLTGFGAIVGRLYNLQVTNAPVYSLRAHNNRIRVRVVAPQRGDIVDRHGVLLATSDPVYRLFLMPNELDDLDPTLARLAGLLGLPEEMVVSMRQEAREHPETPLPVAFSLTYGDVARVALNLPQLPGVSLTQVGRRRYLFGSSMAQMLGYVRPLDRRAALVDDPPPQTRLLAARKSAAAIGVTGLEAQYNDTLFGNTGTQQVEVSARGQVVRDVARTAPIAGRSIRLHVDAAVQQKASSLLKPYRAGAIVALDARHGAVRVMASTPSFDPSKFVSGLSNQDWQSLKNQPLGPLNNRVIQAQYAPGSIFKLMVALAALEHGISPQQRYFCPGHLDVGTDRFHCWRERGHGRLDMRQAISQSCDVWFYEVADRIGMEAIAQVARRFGFGSPTGIDLPSEKRGIAADPDWKRENRGKAWVSGDTMVAAIGQGYMLATPLQMATMVLGLLNNRRIIPHMMMPGDEEPELAENPGSSEELLDHDHRRLLIGAMNDVVNHGRGTANRLRPPTTHAILAGKTATAQVRSIALSERDETSASRFVPWRYRDHSMFVGYAPVDDPRWVVSTVIEHGGSSSEAAVPISFELLLFAHNRDRILLDTA